MIGNMFRVTNKMESEAVINGCSLSKKNITLQILCGMVL